MKKLVFITVAIPLFAYIYLGNFHTQWLYFYVQKIKHGNQIYLGADKYSLADEYAIATNKHGSYIVVTKDTPVDKHNLFFDLMPHYLNEFEVSQLDTIDSPCLVLEDSVENDNGLRVIKLLLMTKVLLVVETNNLHIAPNHYCESITIS